MSNWTAITSDHLKASGYGTVVDRAQSQAAGSIDPIVEAIADAVSRVRAACSTGNALDVDSTKVPNSLKGLTIRIAFFSLCERIGLPLSEDQRESRKNDNSYLLRISDSKMRFEAPDTAAGSAEMQRSDGIETVSQTNRDQYSREGMAGL